MTGSGENPPRDFEEARRRARYAANEAVGDKLDRIIAGADELQQVFEDLKLKDEVTYERVAGIVEMHIELCLELNRSLAQSMDPSISATAVTMVLPSSRV